MASRVVLNAAFKIAWWLKAAFKTASRVILNVAFKMAQYLFESDLQNNLKGCSERDLQDGPLCFCVS